MQLATTVVTLFSVLFPAKMWFAPTQPLLISVKHDTAVALVLTDFAGKVVEIKDRSTSIVQPNQEADLRKIYPSLATAGTYVLWAVPQGKDYPEFVGTPLVVEVRSDKRPGMGDEPIVVKVSPLRYAVMSTDQGEMTMAFYYDVAPNTAASFLTLADQGFYNGLTFHRIVPGFVIQGGDPHGDGIGGPGYNIDAEFNDRKHEEGVLSMARNGDPLEQQGMKPRCEFANSAGSQFFVCLGTVPHLDNKYTAFGKVVEGAEAFKAIAAVPVADKRSARPEKPPVIKKVEVRPVTAEKNPYAAWFGMKK